MAYAPPAIPGAWPKRRRTWSITFFRRYRCGNGARLAQTAALLPSARHGPARHGAAHFPFRGGTLPARTEPRLPRRRPHRAGAFIHRFGSSRWPHSVSRCSSSGRYSILRASHYFSPHGCLGPQSVLNWRSRREPHRPVMAESDYSPLPRRAEGRQTGVVRARCLSRRRVCESGRAGGLERGKPQAGAAGRVSLGTFLPRSKQVPRPPGRDPAIVNPKYINSTFVIKFKKLVLHCP